MKNFLFGAIVILFVSSCFGLYDPNLIDPEKVVVFKVQWENDQYGDIAVHLFEDEAPVTVANFKSYVESGFYDGLIFHRVEENFVLQAGLCDPNLTYREPADPIVNENPNGLSNTRGTLSMARTNEPDSATSQFFVNNVDNTSLDYTNENSPGYCVFGEIIDGMGIDVVEAIRTVDVETGYSDDPNITYPLNNKPVNPVIIRQAGYMSEIGYCSEYKSGDFNKDCRVDINDFYEVSQAWLSDGFEPVGLLDTVEWSATYDEAFNHDIIRDMAVDAAGNVYVTGESKNGSESYNVLTIKYDADGTELWTMDYNNDAENGIDKGNALAVDSSGNVYVAGETDRGNKDFILIKYDSDGVEQWAEFYDGTGGSHDIAYDVAIDKDDYIYVTGKSIGDNGTYYDYVTLKYDGQGQLFWARPYHSDELSNGYDQPVAMAIDDANDIYVTGFSEGDGTGYDIVTVKYDSLGNEDWTSRVDYIASNDDRPSAIAVHESGVFLSATCENAFGGSDFCLVKIDRTNGDNLGVVSVTRDGTLPDKAMDVVLDDAGNIYATGRAYFDETGADIYTVRFNPGGTEDWAINHNSAENKYDQGFKILQHSDGDIVVLGSVYTVNQDDDLIVLKYLPDSGQLRDMTTFNNDIANDEETPVALGSFGSTIFAAAETTALNGRQDYLVIRFAPEGQCRENPTLDFDGNCVVDQGDIFMYAQDWITSNITFE